MAKYIVHKAVEIEKVKKKLRPTEAQLVSEYLAYPKYDGCNMTLIKGTLGAADSIELFSRTGEEVRSAEHIKEAAAALGAMPPGVYFGEYWHPEIDQPTVSGWFRKQDGTQYPEAKFVIFDFVSLGEWHEGHSPLGYHERVDRLPQLLGLLDESKSPIFLAESQGFLIDQEVSTDKAAQLFAQSGAFDGIILRKPSGTWTKGDLGTNGEIIKVKPTITLDLRVVGVNMSTGEKTGRDVWTVVVSLGYDHKYPGAEGTELVQEVGSGVPHDSASLPVIGDIVEIEAMSFSKYGLLREPRYKGIRHDKVEADR